MSARFDIAHEVTRSRGSYALLEQDSVETASQKPSLYKRFFKRRKASGSKAPKLAAIDRNGTPRKVVLNECGFYMMDVSHGSRAKVTDNTVVLSKETFSRQKVGEGALAMRCRVVDVSHKKK
ncbi:MAG: hypothetical protein S4CHLAM37_16530 [Chlamydiia bacterium]|nr:hypothetical protein [Chlamydiia bacterium]